VAWPGTVGDQEVGKKELAEIHLLEGDQGDLWEDNILVIGYFVNHLKIWLG
jgi:hypothetical protein